MDRRPYGSDRALSGRDGDSQAKRGRSNSLFAFTPRSAAEIKRRMYLRMLLVASSIVFIIWCLMEAGAYSSSGIVPSPIALEDLAEKVSETIDSIPTNSTGSSTGAILDQNLTDKTGPGLETIKEPGEEAVTGGEGVHELETTGESKDTFEGENTHGEADVKAETVIGGGDKSNGDGGGEGEGQESEDVPLEGGNSEVSEKHSEEKGEAADFEPEPTEDSKKSENAENESPENENAENDNPKNENPETENPENENAENDDPKMDNPEYEKPGDEIPKAHEAKNDSQDVPKEDNGEGEDKTVVTEISEDGTREGDNLSNTNEATTNGGTADEVTKKSKEGDEEEERDDEEEDGEAHKTKVAVNNAGNVEGREELEASGDKSIQSEGGDSGEAGVTKSDSGEEQGDRDESDDDNPPKRLPIVETTDREEEEDNEGDKKVSNQGEGAAATGEGTGEEGADDKLERVDGDGEKVETEDKVVQQGEEKSETGNDAEGDDGAVDDSATKDTSSSCDGRWVYLYKLPQRYNKLILEKCSTLLPWYDMCPSFLNDGMGKVIGDTQTLLPSSRWFETHENSLEVYFHARLRRSYDCLTTDPEKAVLFYIPFYAALDVVRWHFAMDATNAKRDRLSYGLVRYLNNFTYFAKHGGVDHVMVISKPTWDFHRKPEGDWGNVLLDLPELSKVTKLLSERNTWENYDVAIPHPSYFHPRTDRDLASWQRRVFSHKRDPLVSFAAFPKANSTLRETLSTQCKEQPFHCRYMECIEDMCSRPGSITGLFMSSSFCLMPPGEPSVRRAVFQALVAGCIPVLFDEFSTSVQFPWHLPTDHASYSIHVPMENVQNGAVNVIDMLKTYTTSQKRAMKDYIVHTLLPGLLYSHPRAKTKTYKDAFDISLDRMLQRARVLKQRGDESTSSNGGTARRILERH